MPSDDLADGTADLSITNGNDIPNPSTNAAEIRLQHEAQELQRRQRSLPTRIMRDVTGDFTAATEQLRPGELIKDEYFTLFEAVGALEITHLIDRFHAFEPPNIDKKHQIMDPKMDSGYVSPGDSFEPDFDLLKLSPSQILWIMDEIFRMEMSFHDGYPLAQNLYTSLHIFDLLNQKVSSQQGSINRSVGNKGQTTDEATIGIILEGYCIAVLKCVSPMLSTITSQTYYEEEDLVTHLFGRELLPGISFHDARKFLVEAMDWLDHSDIDPPLKFAIKYRLVCRQDILFCMDKSHECWEKLRSKLDAKTQDGTNVLSSHRKLADPVPEAFSTKVVRQLPTSTPPRPMPELSWEYARQKWVHICEHILAAQRLTSLPIRTIPHALQRATWAFAYRKPEPNTFARAKMQEILCTDDHVAGDMPHMELVLEDLRELYLAGDPLGDHESFQIELTSDPRHRASRVLEEFIQKVCGEYVNLYRIVCQNRCRLRRNLGVSVGLWKEIETEAAKVDSALRKVLQTNRWARDDEKGIIQHSPLFSWAHSYLIQIMMWVVLLGFETELYQPREMAAVYAHTFYLAEEQVRHMRYTKVFTLEKFEEARKKGQRQYVDECKAAAPWIDILSVRYNMHVYLSTAFSATYAMLEKLHIIDTSTRIYEKQELQFEARMKPYFGGVQEKIGFMSDGELNMIRTSHEDLEVRKGFPSIVNCLKKSRELLAVLKKARSGDGKFYGTEEEWVDEIKQLERSCISLGVEASKLQALCKKHGMEDGGDLSDLVEVEIPHPSQRYHVWWVVPQVKEKKI